jgi:hypothetical protein
MSRGGSVAESLPSGSWRPGVSAGAAASYATALAPTASASGRESCLRDFYEDFYEAQVRFAREKDAKRFAKDVRRATKNLVRCLRRDDDD